MKKHRTTKVSLIITAIIAVVFSFAVEFFNSPLNTQNPQKFKDCDVLVHYIDVGQGDAIFVNLPDDRTMLIDAGETDTGIVDYITGIGETKIDYLIATHPHSDHIGGMADVINTFEINKFFMPEVSHTTSVFENMIDALIVNQVDSQYIKSGDIICDSDGLKIQILSPNNGQEFDDLNNYSAVVKLTYKNKSFLFTGDAEKKAEKLITRNISADVLKVGHHGSDTSTGKEFLDKVNPEIAVISVGAHNDYGHPDSRVLKRLEKKNITILRTDISGTIIIGTDGDNIIY